MKYDNIHSTITFVDNCQQKKLKIKKLKKLIHSHCRTQTIWRMNAIYQFPHFFSPKQISQITTSGGPDLTPGYKG
jgi:hypothetical protein